ncbi:MAG: hypothetical protein V4805_13785 [Pseudomonadota bacterium]
MTPIARRATFATLVVVSVAAAATVWWMKSEYTPVEPIRVAQEFLQKLKEEQFAQAFELTVKHGYVGRTPAELQEISQGQLCKVERMVSTFPFQSNGNRLRRLVSGREIEMPQVSVEFAGDCLLGVTVHRTKSKEWRVFGFANHAG